MNADQREKREMLLQEMRKSAETGQPMDRARLPGGWSFSTPTFYVDAHAFWQCVLILMVLLGLLFVPARGHAAPLASGCDDAFEHHSPATSPYFDRLFSGRVWTDAKTGSVIAAVWIAECGRYLIGIWRNGRFTTHFLASWGYVLNQLRGFARIGWGDVLVRSWGMFLFVPCPGTYGVGPNAWARPCPQTGEQT